MNEVILERTTNECSVLVDDVKLSATNTTTIEASTTITTTDVAVNVSTNDTTIAYVKCYANHLAITIETVTTIAASSGRRVSDKVLNS